MPGLYDIIEQMMGRSNPVDQLAAGLGQGPTQAGSPSGPQPLAAGGASAPPPTGAPPEATGGAGPQQGPPPQQQGPQAYQSPQDMQQMYAQLMQHQAGQEQFNRGLGMFMSAFGRPRNQQAIQNQWAGMTPDAGEVMGNIMKAQLWNQQQQRLQGLQASVPGLVQSFGWDKAMIPYLQNNPAAIDSLVSSHQPTGAYANRQLAEADYIKNNSDPNDPQSVAKARADFEAKVPLISALTPAGGDPTLNALNLEHNDYLSKHGSQEPDDDRFTSTEALAAYKAHNAALSNAQTAAGSSFPALDGAVVSMRKSAQDIAQDPDLENVLNLSPATVASARKGGYGAELAQTLGVTQHQLQLLQQIDELRNSNTSQLKTSNPHLLPSFQPVDADLGGLNNFAIGKGEFQTRLTSLTNDLTTLRAQGIGASGQLTKALATTPDGKSPADEDVGAKIDPSYLPGGSNYLGEPKKLTPDLVTWAKQQITAGTPRDKVILHLKLGGYLPKGEF